MLLLQPVSENSAFKSEYVKCPSCKRGRLCDKPSKENVTSKMVLSNQQCGTSSCIILKCPKCGQKFFLYFQYN